jgi:hypothetical protein
MALSAVSAFGERHELVSLEVAAPPVGNPVQYLVPVLQTIQVVGFTVSLTTSLVAGDRRVISYGLTSLGTRPLQHSVSSVLQAATLTYSYRFSCGIGNIDASGDALAVYAPLSCGVQIDAGETFNITAHNLDVGDQFGTAWIRVYRWVQG